MVAVLVHLFESGEHAGFAIFHGRRPGAFHFRQFDLTVVVLVGVLQRGEGLLQGGKFIGVDLMIFIFAESLENFGGGTVVRCVGFFRTLAVFGGKRDCGQQDYRKHKGVKMGRFQTR